MDNSIDLVSNIALNSISNKAAPTGSVDAADNNDSDTIFRSRFAELLDRAIAAPDIDQEAVTQANAMIANETLDTPQNKLSAAQNIIIQGI